jgi:citronellol/citronellal dehydrogenase
MSDGDAQSQLFARGLLAGQAALVTGGGTGLGRATALELVRCGADVTIAGRRAEVLEQAVAEIEQAAGGEQAGAIDYVAGDIREREDARRLVGTALAERGRLDLLVNNAGGQFFSPAELIAAKGWRAVWRLNVEGMLNMAEAAFELALGRADGDAGGGGGMVVNVEALTRELAERWQQAGVAVTAVAAGMFETDALSKYPANVRAGAARSVPLQRLGSAAEHAWLVALLASPLGRAFNGSTITLDGARDNWFGPWPPPGLADEAGTVPVEERRQGVAPPAA